MRRTSPLKLFVGLQPFHDAMIARMYEAQARIPLVAGALVVVLAWVGDKLRLYEHPHLGFINPGPSLLLALLLAVGLVRGWGFVRSFTLAYLSLACLGYLLVSFQHNALEGRALSLAAGAAFLLYLLIPDQTACSAPSGIRRFGPLLLSLLFAILLPVGLLFAFAG